MAFKSGVSLDESLSFSGPQFPRLWSKEVKMMTSNLSCAFDTSYASSVVEWLSSRHQNGGGRHESTNILAGLPVDWNGRIRVKLASTKIKNRKGDMYLNWNFCGRKNFRLTWIKAPKWYIVSTPFLASFSSELCHIIVCKVYVWRQNSPRKHVNT